MSKLFCWVTHFRVIQFLFPPNLSISLFFILPHAIIIGIIFPLLTPLNNATYLEHDFVIFYVAKNLLWTSSAFDNNFHTFFILKENSSHFTAMLLTFQTVECVNEEQRRFASKQVRDSRRTDWEKASQRREEKLTKFREKICNSRKRLSLHAHKSQRSTASEHEVLTILLEIFNKFQFAVWWTCALSILSGFSPNEMNFWEKRLQSSSADKKTST